MQPQFVAGSLVTNDGSEPSDNFDWSIPEKSCDIPEVENKKCPFKCTLSKLNIWATVLAMASLVPVLLNAMFKTQFRDLWEVSVIKLSIYMTIYFGALPALTIITYFAYWFLQAVLPEKLHFLMDMAHHTIQPKLLFNWALIVIIAYPFFLPFSDGLQEPGHSQYFMYLLSFATCVLVTSICFLVKNIFIWRFRLMYRSQTLMKKVSNYRYRSFVIGELLKYATRNDPEASTESLNQDWCCRYTEATPLVDEVHLRLSMTRRRFVSALNSFDMLSENIGDQKSLLSSSQEASTVAKKIFTSISTNQTDLTKAEFSPVFGTQQAADDAFNVFDRDEDGTVSRLEFKNSIYQMFKDHVNLQTSLTGSTTEVSYLDKMITYAMMFFLFFFYLTTFHINPGYILSMSISAITVSVVLFKDAVMPLLLSGIFIFSVHPYDVGDEVIVDKEKMIVKKIEFSCTHFKLWDGTIVIIANHILYTKTIKNLSRATEQWEKIDFEINLSTSDQKLSELRSGIVNFLESNPGFFYPKFEMIPYESPSLNKLLFTVTVRCKITNDSERHWERHGKLLHFLKSTVEALGIIYYSPQ